MTQKLRSAGRVVITALFVSISAVMLALLLPSSWKVMSVQTGSMEPALSPGDLIVVRSLPAAEYKTGDVVTFINPADRSQTITHRVVDRADGPYRSVFTTQGDANASADQPISENLIIGKQVASLPFLGRAVDFARTLPGLMLIIWLPALILIAGEGRRLINYYRDRDLKYYQSRVPYRLYGRTGGQT